MFIMGVLVKEAGLKKLDKKWNKILEEDEFIPFFRRGKGYRE